MSHRATFLFHLSIGRTRYGTAGQDEYQTTDEIANQNNLKCSHHSFAIGPLFHDRPRVFVSAWLCRDRLLRYT
jgi:hypothetical protein